MFDYQQYIYNKLRAIYPEDEIQSLSRLLLEEVSGIPASLFFSDKSNQLNAQQEKRLDDILERLQKYEPLQYILGETEFYGLPFSVNQQVLIPRPETEELVEWIVTEYVNKPIRILDIGTGSGCIAVTLAKKLPKATLEAWDVSPNALAVASENANRNKVNVCFKQINVLSDEIPFMEKWDVIVSNPPYVLNSEKEQMHRNVLDYEPALALFVSDNDPLLFYRRIAELGKTLLHSNGVLFYEINAALGAETVEMLDCVGYAKIELKQDLSGNDRMVKALVR